MEHGVRAGKRKLGAEDCATVLGEGGEGYRVLSGLLMCHVLCALGGAMERPVGRVRGQIGTKVEVKNSPLDLAAYGTGHLPVATCLT